MRGLSSIQLFRGGKGWMKWCKQEARMVYKEEASWGVEWS